MHASAMKSLHASRSTAEESVDIGIEILNEMGRQREKIIAARKKVRVLFYFQQYYFLFYLFFIFSLSLRFFGLSASLLNCCLLFHLFVVLFLISWGLWMSVLALRAAFSARCNKRQQYKSTTTVKTRKRGASFTQQQQR